MSAGRALVRPSDTPEATAAGIYGVIVSAAVMAATHAPTATAVVAAVLVTLCVYWAAERYALIVAERIHEGHRPSWRIVWRRMTGGWELVTASVLPLLVLVLARVLGAELRTAVLCGLTCSTVVLCGAGWHVGRGGRLTTAERLISSAIAGFFGVGLILLKALLH